MKTIKRRKKEHKTDYGKRLKLLKSGKPRIVFRKTNKYVIAQYVTSKEAQDKIKIGVNSKKLLEYGWPKENEGSLKSIPASYLTGILIGKKILKEGEEKPIADFGMLNTPHKTKIFAFLKGLIDSGLEIECKDEIFPPQERIEGKHLKKKIPFKEILLRISESLKSEKQNLSDKKIKSKTKK